MGIIRLRLANVKQKVAEKRKFEQNVRLETRITVQSFPAGDTIMNLMTATLDVSVKHDSRWLVVGLLSAGLAVDYLTRLGIYSVLPLLRRELIAMK